jgi:hypothetical protein
MMTAHPKPLWEFMGHAKKGMYYGMMGDLAA